MLSLVMVATQPATHRRPRPPGERGDSTDEIDFTLDHLPGVRRFVAVHARKYGLDEESVGDLVIAVNEIATNSVRHGSPSAELRMGTAGGRLIAELHDHGNWTPSTTVGNTPPASDAEGGMGLWVTRQICSAVRITTGEDGTTVRLEMPLPARAV